MHELGGVDTFLTQRLAADPIIQQVAGGRVFSDLAPEGTAFPYVIFSLNAERGLGMIGSCDRVASIPDYLVKAVTEGRSYQVALQLANAIDRAVVGAFGSAIADGQEVQIKAVRCITRVRYTEQADGTQYRHMGGVYRMQARGVTE
jgi:hypothetical protein